MSPKKLKTNENLSDNASVPAQEDSGDALKAKKKPAAKPASAPQGDPAPSPAGGDAKKKAKKAPVKAKKPKAEKTGASAAAATHAEKKPHAAKPHRTTAAEIPPEPPKPALTPEQKAARAARLITSISRPETVAPPPPPGYKQPQAAKKPEPLKPQASAAHTVKPALPPARTVKPVPPAAHTVKPARPAARPEAVKPPHAPVKPAVKPAAKSDAVPPAPPKPGVKAPIAPVKPAEPSRAVPAPVPPPPPAAGGAEPPKPESLKVLPKITVSTQMIVRELAEKIGVKPTDFIKKLMGMGVFATINQRLDPDVATLVAADYGFDLEIVPIYDEEVAEVVEKESPENLKPRNPIVTIMGHVDHGKTTLLDAFRQSNVVDSEAGQITQHIGAYMVKTSRGKITILDTPGHEAFTAMRAHGVKITDIVILVISAVDGVMPQTLEAINHAKAANVPIIVAINKMDLPTANPQEIKQRLANIGLNPEDWGGATMMVEISAKKRANLEKLLEMVAIQAEMMELKANPDALGSGIVIEARLDSKMGMLATVIAVNGAIKVGNPFVVGTSHGKVRALINDRGERLERIGPGEPSGLLGISGEIPHAGDVFKVYKTEKEARHVAEKRKLHKREEALIHQKHVSLLSLKSQVDQKLLKNLNIVLKTDVFGSLQAIKDSLERLSTHEVAIHILHSGVGNVTESDVLLAKASDAVIFGFHVDCEAKVQDEAKSVGVELRTYQIIYDLLEDVRAAMSGLLAPEVVETVTGRAEIQQLFELSSGRVAGSLVREGKVIRNQAIRIMRGSSLAGVGKISGLKRFKEDVKEVEKGLECGIMIEGFRDYKPGDIVEALTREEKVRRISHV
ncbi:MAG: translation initiation factor IF-2 [Elusimicrobia bacterium]|nr:translation initiation factor IF-2 [Elusimicrobiota bacterium]